MIDTPEALDAISAQCNRKGFRERALQATLKEQHAQLLEPFQADLPRTITSVQGADQKLDGMNEADRRTIQACCFTLCIATRAASCATGSYQHLM